MKKVVRSKEDEIKRCFGFDDSSCSDDEYLSYNSCGSGGGTAVANNAANNVSCNSTLAGISPVHRIQSSFLQNNRLMDASVVLPGEPIVKPDKAKPARFVPPQKSARHRQQASTFVQPPSVLSSTVLSMKSTYLSPKNQVK